MTYTQKRERRKTQSLNSKRGGQTAAVEELDWPVPTTVVVLLLLLFADGTLELLRIQLAWVDVAASRRNTACSYRVLATAMLPHLTHSFIYSAMLRWRAGDSKSVTMVDAMVCCTQAEQMHVRTCTH